MDSSGGTPTENIHKILNRMLNMQDVLKDKTWPAPVIMNHDSSPQSRFIDTSTPELHNRSEKLLAFMLTMKGTPVIYNGQELGRTNPKFTDISDYRDVMTMNLYDKLKKEGRPEKEIMQVIMERSRDGARVLMPWDSNTATNGGFSEIKNGKKPEKPWISPHPKYQESNVKKQEFDPESILNFYKKMIQIRKDNKALIYGDNQLITDKDGIFAYTQTLGNEKMLIVLNITPDAVKHNIDVANSELLISNYENSTQPTLKPYEARLYKFNTEKITDLSGEWEYFSGDKMPKPEQKGDKMNLPSNWFLMGKKEFPKNFKLNKNGSFNPYNPQNADEGMNYSGTMWYRKTLHLNKLPDKNKPLLLDLDMVDYYGQVYLNGKPIGKEHEGYFQKWTRNITEALKPGDNEILIRVSDPKLPYDPTGEQYPSWPDQNTQIKGIFERHDCRPGSTSIDGQELSTGGIIKGLQLRQSSGLDIQTTKITPEFDPVSVSKYGADVKMQLELKNWTNKPKKVVISNETSPHNFKDEDQVKKTKTEVIIPPNSTVPVDQVIHIKNPKLWWTWDKGQPNLYESKLKIEEKDKILDENTSIFGIRTITRDDNNAYYLNGEKLYLRGTNFISTQWLSQADKDWYQRDVDLIKKANLNSIIVHAHIPRPELYDVLDKEGIVAIQGFPLIWRAPENEGFIKNAKQQTKDMVERFNNHPSLIAWIAHNEGNQNPKLDGALVGTLEAIDSSRPVIPVSGEPSNGKYFDRHSYPGWYQPFTDSQLSEGSFTTEFGAQALSDIKTIQQVLPKESQWPPDSPENKEVWADANFQAHQMFDIAGVSKGKNLEEFIQNSQKYQAKLLQYEIEYLRRHKNDQNKPSTGEFQFMMVDPWPAVSSWSVVDYNRTPKLGYQAVKKASQPLLPSIEYKWNDPDSNVKIVLINDYNKQFNNLQVKYQLGNEKLKTFTIEKIEPDSVKPILNLGKLPDVVKGNQSLKVWIIDPSISDSSKKVISNNSLNF